MEVSKKRQGESYSAREKQMIFNAFTYFARNMNVTRAVEETSKALLCSKATVYVVRREKENPTPESHVKEGNLTRKNSRLHIYNEDVQMLVRRKVHSFFLQNIPPTVSMILTAVNNDEEIPNFSRSTLYRFLGDIGFTFETIGKKVMLMDRDDIIRWRHDYLRTIKKYREEGRNIVYTDETWINTGHFVTKAWTDNTVSTSRQAFIENLSTGINAPKGRGQRFAMIHAGNENGFITGAEYHFPCLKNSADAHDEVCAEVYENWFFNHLLPNLPEHSVIVIDNAPYHSRKLEKIPNMSWKKHEIVQWLDAKNITIAEGLLKRDLVQIVSQEKQKYDKYALDYETVKRKHTILRLPPYHCVLNPIEMVWAQVKGYIRRHNTTFKTQNISTLIEEGYESVSVDNWKNYIKHIKKGKLIKLF